MKLTKKIEATIDADGKHCGHECFHIMGECVLYKMPLVPIPVDGEDFYRMGRHEKCLSDFGEGEGDD